MPDTEAAKDKDDASEKELADARTGWAEDRTILANERTFAAWMRTGMACVALALGLKAVFGATDHPIVAKLVAELFVLCAILIFISAARKSRTVLDRTDSHDASPQSRKNMALIASVLIVGAISTGVILWLL